MSDLIAVASLAADKDLEKGQILFRMLAEGYSGEQILDRFAIAPDRIEDLVARYVQRIVRGDIPDAPTVECLINGFDGWCMKHGCFHGVRR